MSDITGAHHTSFTVANLDRSLEFFRDLLGLEVLYTREIKDDYFGLIVGLPGCVVKAALLRLPQGHHVELFEYLEPRGQSFCPRPCDPGSVHLSLVVKDLPRLYAKLVDRGIAFVSEPVPISGGPNRGGYGVYLRDPNGILIELFQPPPQESP
jgi:catechol 2,3-dioxygenase-like lactoylglutathione lyase family enzyme